MSAESLLAILLFLACFFGVAVYALRPKTPELLWKHPAVYALGFYGVSGVLFFYGSVELVGRFGLAGLLAMLIYTVIFIFYPLFLEPLRWISRAQALGSLPDLLVYRYRTARVGQASTLVLAVATLPIAAAQFRSMVDSLLPNQRDNVTASWSVMIVMAVTVIAFVRLFSTPLRARRAIPMVVAFGALLALCAISVCGLLAVYGIFGSYSDLNHWAQATGQATVIQRFDGFYALSLLFFTAPFILPQLIYMQTLGRWWPRNAPTSWMLPLVILVATLPLFPILWAGLHLRLDSPLQSYLLALPSAMDQPLIYLLVLLAGLFMAMSMVTICAIAMGKVALTSYSAVGKKQFTDVEFDRWLDNRRFRAATLWVILALAFTSQVQNISITELTITGMMGMVQLLPALMGTLYLPRVNRYGCLAGLFTGFFLWLAVALIPLLNNATQLDLPLVGSLMVGPSNWAYWLLETLIANLVVMLLVSRLTHTSRDEEFHAHQTMIDSLPTPQRSSLDITSIPAAEKILAKHIGGAAANSEVAKTLDELHIDSQDTRPLTLRMFRDRLSFNLSEKIGTFASERVINEVMPMGNSGEAPVDDISLLETRLANLGGALSGLAAELNKLRLYHRRTLENLPIGVCSVDKDGEILLWNHTMATYSGISPHRIEGGNLEDIPQPWGHLLQAFAESPDNTWPTVEVDQQNGVRKAGGTWFHLHKYRVEEDSPVYAGNQILLIEDISERLRLIQELAHSERLTSVGRLAAGVAHEIGNPVTGISCLAQDLESSATDEETRDTAAMILTQTDRISRIVRTLIDFSRSDDKADHGPVKIRKAVDDAIQLLQLDKSARAVEFRTLIDNSVKVYGDIHQLTQVFVNLLSNARDASHEGGLITLTCEAADNSTVLIHVTDEGSGIPRDIIDRVMDPFFTTKDPGEGTGLGLSLVYSIVRLHGGTMNITSPIHQGSGTRITLSLRVP